MTTIGSAGSASLFNPALNAQPVVRPAKPVFGHISAIRQNHGQMSSGCVNTDNAGTSAQTLDALKERALNTPVSTHFDKFFHHRLKTEIKDKLPSFSGVKGLSGRNKKLAETLLALLQQLKSDSPDEFDKEDSRSLDALFKQADSYKGSEKDFVRKFWKEAAPLITKFGSAVFDSLHNEVTALSEQAWLKKAGESEIGERHVFDAHYRRSAELTAGELDRTGQHILPEIFRDNFENAWRKIISIPHTLVPGKTSPPPAGETPEQPSQAVDAPEASARPDVQFKPDEKNGTPDNTQPMVINYNDNRITIGGDNYHLYADDIKAQGAKESGERCENGNDNPPVFSGIKDALVKVSNQAGNQTDETDSLPHADKAAQIDSGYFDYDVPELALNSDLSTDIAGLTGPDKAGSQPAAETAAAFRTEQSTETAEPAGAGKKWATVQPAAPFIGGSGSASRPVGVNHAGSARAAGNSPGRSTGSGTNDGVAVSATTQTVTGNLVPGAGKTLPAGGTVTPATEDNTFILTPRPVIRTARIVSRDNEETGRPEKTNEIDSLPPHADNATQIDSGYFDYDVPELALNSDLSTDIAGLTGPDKAGSQPAAETAAAFRTEQSTETAEPAGAGKKWATVQPAAPFIGGPGSASRPVGVNHAGSARVAGNSPGRSTGSGTNDGVAVSATTQTVTGNPVPGTGKTPPAGSQPAADTVAAFRTEQSTETAEPAGAGKKWATVLPAAPFIGGSGSASRPVGVNHAGSARAAGNSPGRSTGSGTNDGVAVSATTQTVTGNLVPGAGKTLPAGGTVMPATEDNTFILTPRPVIRTARIVSRDNEETGRPEKTNEIDSLPPHADNATQIDSGYFDYDVPELALNSDLSTDTDGLTGPDKAGSQPATATVAAPLTDRAVEKPLPAGAGKKWATVQPAAPFIGGPGSASRPGGVSHAGSAPAAGNSPGRSTGSGTNDGVAVSATTQTVTGSPVPGAGKTLPAGGTVMPAAEDNTFILTPRPVIRTARIVSRDNEETGRPEKTMSGTDAGHKVMDGVEVDGKMTDAFCDRELSHFVTLLRAQPEAAALKLEHIRHPAHLATLVKSAFTRGVYWEAGAHRARVLKSGLAKYQQTDGYRVLVKAVENGRVQSDRLHDFYFQLGRIAAGQTPKGERQSRPVYLTEAKPASLNSRALFANTLPEKS